jgi:hypothetical protein
MLEYTVPPLRYLVEYIRPRWHAPFGSARRLVGVAILLIGNFAVCAYPIEQCAACLATMLLSFAYLEEDGMLLCVASVIILVLLLIAGAAAWQMMSVAGWVTGSFLVPNNPGGRHLQLEHGRITSHMASTPRTRVPEFLHVLAKLPGKPTSLQPVAPG